MDEVLGNFSVELDGRFSAIRTSETNLGNFICDIMMAACNGDVALLNSGTLRSDRIHPRGEFKMRDLMTILPMLDPLLVLEITGELLERDNCSCGHAQHTFASCLIYVLSESFTLKI